ncbi:unnamed protein product [Rotaria socialis]|uniref:ATP synthase F0 subunit 8 n=2 Tax=Rotaria socialis TaxID=392032 RepID=A0A820Q8N5_9BILA|nr:unnamed protein product [Rotaria socialis]CAF3241232.1 unnamed protein product [Rotaria socialis]CAF3713291.1 unnamed protein product [Rotaria socialis]CAF4416857.1 unnamed protein product [Rotaria socialis]CAF4895155.1 unnamed protein product [Rotaria socialis]
MMFLFNSSFLFTFILIILPLIQTIPVDDQQPQRHRFRRGIFNFFSDIKKHDASGNIGSSVIVNDNVNDAESNKAKYAWLSMAKSQGSRLMQGGTDLALLPVNWLTNIVNNWPLYLICITIIMSLIAFLYCSCQAGTTKLLMPKPR